jgi:Asp-tRNA(Asn)/Glu-tRNA(Gln) amidotransferase A subunit family amidase
MTAKEMRTAFSRREISPVEAAEASLAAVQELGTRFNAIASFDPDVARQEALASETRFRAGEPLGPLDGVPVTVKDSFHVKGLPRWHGSAANSGGISRVDAAPIRRLREAGMVIVAKTAMPDYALLMSGLSSRQGTIRNPWDPDTNPGGSSSGAGPSVAAGVAPIGIGTDMVGSVRLPAALTGLASIKPTQGRIAYDPPGNYRSVGPMAKTADDVEETLKVLGKSDPADHFALQGEYGPPERPFNSLRGMTVGVIRRLSFGSPVDPETAEAVESQAERLAELGAELVDVERLVVDETDYESIYWLMIYNALPDYFALEARDRGRVLPAVGQMMDATLQQSALFAAASAKRLMVATERLRNQLDPFDYVLSPALPVRAFPADELSPSPELGPMSHMGFACWFNQLSWPAGTIPVSWPHGRGCPISIQIGGKRFDDAGVLNVMRLLEARRDFEIRYPVLKS